MKVLMVGSNLPYAIERYFVKYLGQMGVEIELYTSADIVFNNQARNLLSKVLFRTKLKTGYGPVNRELQQVAHRFRPDVIWVFKGMEIYPATLKKLREDFKLANYNPDHPFLITSRGSGNRNVSQGVGQYHLHFCYHNEVMRQITQDYGIPTVFLPFAYDTGDMVYTDPATLEEIPRVCFQANPDSYRVRILEDLAAAGLEIDAYGHGWDKTRLVKNPRVRVFPIASRAEFWRLNQQYRVQLNLFRKYNAGSHNMRTFEIPAVGGIQVAPYSAEQAGFFTENQEIFFFRQEKELPWLLKGLLEKSPAQTAQIRAAARKRSLESGYTFYDRAVTVYNSFKQLI